MKRTVKKIKRKFFIFWKFCNKCKKEFRFEHGWVHETGPYYGGRGKIVYVCESCVPNEKEAQLYFSYSKFRKINPPNRSNRKKK